MQPMFFSSTSSLPPLSSTLDVHGRQRQDLRPLLLPQFCCHDAADSRPNGLAGLVDQHAGVVVELDHATVRSLPLLRCAHDDCVADISSPHFVGGADGHAVAGLGSKVALLLNDYDDAVAWLRQPWQPRADGPDLPTFAGRFDRRTLTHSTMAAPELSMQLTRVWRRRISVCRSSCRRGCVIAP